MTELREPKAANSSSVSRRRLAGLATGLIGSIWATSAMAQRHGGWPHNPPGPSTPGGAACFLRGTSILTPEGERTIESIETGDMIVTADGRVQRVLWATRRSIARIAGQTWKSDVLPIRIAKDAIAENVPQRDLFVSPNHNMLVDGVLISAASLVNGKTIHQVDCDADSIDYFHLELRSHDVLVANGAPTESLLVTAGNIAMFENIEDREAIAIDLQPCAPVFALYGRRDRWSSQLRRALSPIVDIRRPVEKIRDRIAERAAA